MTASPDQFSRPTAPAWYVHTDQGVMLAGPFDTEAEARTAGNDAAARLRAGMRRDRQFTEADVRARVAALRVGFGTTTYPHGGFVAVGA